MYIYVYICFHNFEHFGPKAHVTQNKWKGAEYPHSRLHAETIMETNTVADLEALL